MMDGMLLLPVRDFFSLSLFRFGLNECSGRREFYVVITASEWCMPSWSVEPVHNDAIMSKSHFPRRGLKILPMTRGILRSYYVFLPMILAGQSF